MTTKLARQTDKNGNIKYPPHASHKLIIEGTDVQDLMIDEVEALALTELLNQRSKKKNVVVEQVAKKIEPEEDVTEEIEEIEEKDSGK